MTACEDSLPKKAAQSPPCTTFSFPNSYVVLRVRAATESGPRCCRMPACLPRASCSARAANGLPQTSPHRDAGGG